MSKSRFTRLIPLPSDICDEIEKLPVMHLPGLHANWKDLLGTFKADVEVNVVTGSCYGGSLPEAIEDAD